MTDRVDPDRGLAIEESHCAVVFLVADRAYKLKKPVDFGFLDFRTRASRQTVCHREVDLNRRLTPDVYLGVADVLDPAGAPCDHLVVMRRMPADRRMSTLVRTGRPVRPALRSVARQLAAFHATARRSPEIDQEGSRDAILRRWTASFEQVRAFHDTVIDAALADEITRLTIAFLAGREDLFDERITGGRIVDGHGDLLADDIFCLDDGPRILDCIEFDDRLRYLDGLDDAAFLAMDLQRLGADDASAQFLDSYAEFAADPAPPSLRHHYVAYRAFVRAKVACLRHAQGDPHAAADAIEHARLTAQHLRAGQVRLILVGGSPGTGKTTLAGRLADQLGAVTLNSDRIRKELAGLPPERPAAAGFREGIYTARWTRRTYDELVRRAESLLRRGETVILDASFADAADRVTAADLATRTRSPLVSLRCHADPRVVDARLRHRHGGVSDADERIAAALTARFDPWPDAVLTFTDVTLDRSLQRAVSAIDAPDRPAAVNAAG